MQDGTDQVHPWRVQELWSCERTSPLARRVLIGVGRAGVALIRMVTPVTPPQRLEQLCRGSQGFIYAVTMTGVTGANASAGGVALPEETLAYLKRVRDLSPVPVCAGFGIRSNAQVKLLDPHVDGVIVGSALVEVLEKDGSVTALLQGIRGSTT